MIDPTVRAARADDVAEIELLQAEARAALVHQRGGDRWLELHPPQRDWSEPIAAGRVAVAVIDAVPVGYLAVSLDGDVARIDDVYVVGQARELGFGDELLAWGLAWARSQGARLLEGVALPGDRETKNLYERAGIKARMITVSIAIDR